MSNKVQLIKEEIERRISQFEAKYPKDLGGYWNDEESAAYDCAEEYKRFLQFIDSIPEESVSENLDRLVINLEETIGTSPHSREVIKEHLQKAAEWQKQQMMKDAINGIMDCDDDNEWIEITDKLIVTPSKAGKKVKFIVVKEE